MFRRLLKIRSDGSVVHLKNEKTGNLNRNKNKWAKIVQNDEIEASKNENFQLIFRLFANIGTASAIWGADPFVGPKGATSSKA